MVHGVQLPVVCMLWCERLATLGCRVQIECDVPDVLDVVDTERPCANGAELLKDACVK